MAEEQKKLNLLKLITNNINDIITIHYLDGSCRYVSPSVQKVLGYSPAELIGTLVYPYYHPEDVKRIRELFRQAAAGKTDAAIRFEYRIRRKDGSYAWLQTEATRIPDSTGKLLQALSISRDITECKRLEKSQQEREILILELQRRSDFIDHILQRKNLNARNAIAARTFGIDFRMPLFCCLIHIEREKSLQDEDNFSFRIIELLSSDPKLFVWDFHGDIGILCQYSNLSHEPEAGMKIAAGFMKKITTYDSGITVKIGIGGTHCGPEGIKKSCRQAASSVLAARCREEDGNRICHFQKIGIYQLLGHFSREEQTKEFVNEQIGKLVAYDRQKGTNLLHTLEEVLQSANLKEAAARLFIHYNTAVFRKKPIEKVLQVSIDEFETRLALAMAIKLQKLLFQNRESLE